MELSYNYNKHIKNVFELNGFNFDQSEAIGETLFKSHDQVCRILQDLYQPPQVSNPVTIRLMFMPYSLGTYIALILDQDDNIKSWLKSKQEQSKLFDAPAFFTSLQSSSMFEESKDNSGLQQSQQAIELDPEMMKLNKVDSNVSSASSTASQTGVKKKLFENKLFLDTKSLSKNMQVLINNYEMFVVAQVKQITQHVSDGCTKENMFIPEGKTFFKCQIEKVEHIVNFTSQIINKKKEDIDYSFTDYVCK